jgi:hypothetical protein
MQADPSWPTAPDAGRVTDPDAGRRGCGNPVIVTRGTLLSVAEVYFCDSLPELDVDRLYLMQAPRPIQDGHSSVFHSLLIDLAPDETALWQNVRKGCRYEIGRAEHTDGVVYRRVETSDEATLERFRQFYDRFAQKKGLPAVRPNWLAAGLASGAVELSYATDAEGHDLVWHSYYRAPDRVRLLHSASALAAHGDTGLSNLLGRANRYLHWRDIINYKSEGIAIYDMGGWYAGSDDQLKVGINTFKEQFGGRIVHEYNCDVLLTVRARIVTRVTTSIRRLAERGRVGAHGGPRHPGS